MTSGLPIDAASIDATIVVGGVIGDPKGGDAIDAGDIISGGKMDDDDDDDDDDDSGAAQERS